MGELLLGIDVGTYSTKGVLAAPDGRVLKAHSVDHVVSFPRPGWAEQDPETVWWKDLVTICQVILDGSPYHPGDVAGIAVSAIGPCLVALDEAGRPIRPGILYGVDTRAAAEVDYLTEVIGPDTVFAFSGMEFSSQAVGPKILWMRRNEPELWARTKHVTTASSYLILRLTGERVIDRHTASHFMPLMDMRSLEWSDRFSSELVDTRMLPRLAWSDEIAGQVGKGAKQRPGCWRGHQLPLGA